VRYLRRMDFDDAAFTAALIGLASKGALTIEKDGTDFVIESTGDRAGKDSATEERVLAAKLFRKGITVRMVQANHQILTEAKTALQSALSAALERHYFLRNTKFWVIGLLIGALPVCISLISARIPPVAIFLTLWLTGWTAGTGAITSAAISAFLNGRILQGLGRAAFALPFLAGEAFGLTMLWATAGGLVVSIFAVTLTAHAVFYHLLKRPTATGRQALDEIEGFREYLTVAEEDRLNLLNPPAQTPQLFERFLPYAFALDAEQRWSEAFDAVLAQAAQAEGQSSSSYQPAWYAAGAGHSRPAR